MHRPAVEALIPLPTMNVGLVGLYQRATANVVKYVIEKSQCHPLAATGPHVLKLT